MRFEPGNASGLRADINSIELGYRERHCRPGGLTESELLQLVLAPRDEVVSDLEHPSAPDVTELDAIGPDVEELGRKAIEEGSVAFVILAGGSGTRLGSPKALARLPGLGLSLLAHKLTQAIPMQAWVMTSPQLVMPILDHLGTLNPLRLGCVFDQFESYRLSPDNRIAFMAPGVPELHPTGHGDVGPALVESGVFDDSPNVKHCIIVNVDNVLASPEPRVLGHHLATGAHVTCEIVDRSGDDRSGGRLAWSAGRLQVMESFRLPDDFEDSAQLTSTNTMIVSVEALRARLQWRYHRVRKQVGSRIVVQHERLLQQYTEAFDARFVLVPRRQRYLPIKEEIDLERADDALNGNNRR